MSGRYSYVDFTNKPYIWYHGTYCPVQTYRPTNQTPDNRTIIRTNQSDQYHSLPRPANYHHNQWHTA